MPTNRTKRMRVARPGGGELSESQTLWLQGDRDGAQRATFPWIMGVDANPDWLIENYGDAFLAEFVKANPGRRPFWFWNYLELPEDGQRLRVGGVGDPHAEERPGFDMGVPDDNSWNLAWNAKRGGKLDGMPIDPNDPPMFESEASYLRRHNLFLKGEEARLTDVDFDPVSVFEIVPGLAIFFLPGESDADDE